MITMKTITKNNVHFCTLYILQMIVNGYFLNANYDPIRIKLVVHTEQS